MAGLEQLEVHSRSYLIRWVNVPADHTISWSIQPHKKSINFGLYRHPGSGPLTPNLPSAGTFEVTPPSVESEKDQDFSQDADKDSVRRAGGSRNDNTTAVEKLKKLGLISINWVGKCEADKATNGAYPVGHTAGMYALIFDNTFSKQVSKTVTFVLLTYPSSSPPKAALPLSSPNPQAGGGSLSQALNGRLETSSQETLTGTAYGRSRAESELERPRSRPSSEQKYKPVNGFFTGVLHKRRRKKHQGFAKRFFSLDINSSTLSYYHDRHSSALRGAVPLSLAVIGTNEKRREISVDSGAEVWHLRAGNWKEFYAWKEALEEAAAKPAESDTSAYQLQSKLQPKISPEAAEEQEWVRSETLVGRVVGIRDAVRRLAQHVDYQKPGPYAHDLGIHDSSIEPSPVESHGPDYFADRDKRPFWKRKTSSGNTSPGLFNRGSSTQLSVPQTARTASPSPNRGNNDMKNHCDAILKGLDSVVADFSILIAERKQRKQGSYHGAVHRHSIASTLNQEFFDAESGEERASQLFQLPDSDGEQSDGDDYFLTDDESSDEDEPPNKRMTRHIRTDTTLFPSTPKSLKPLPVSEVTRRQTIPKATTLPPSLIAFFRKNMGKDLSTISMPVSANEPLSLLQRFSEMLEYAPLLTKAASLPLNDPLTLAYITAFAISNLSSTRITARAIRKPFNPMLGETFELVRPEAGGYRFISEKVSHRPVQMAMQAESATWTLSSAPKPSQKFWGKSVEIIQEGTIRVVLHTTGECFSWAPAASTLKNLLAGEKYVEPSGTMTVVNESTGAQALVTFKAKGMFSGRSEDITVDFSDGSASAHLSMAGKWTTDLRLADGKVIWSAGPVVDDAAARYGFTRFAAELNEVSDLERGKLPVTDSRLRRDQRAAEEGRLDEAEQIKGALEEGQRARRREMEEKGETWTPRWFEKASGGNDAWVLKGGKDGYWNCRERGEWEGVTDVLGGV